MNDAIDAGMDTADDTETADRVYAQICDEIGVELGEEHNVNNNRIDNGQKTGAVSVLHDCVGGVE